MDFDGDFDGDMLFDFSSSIQEKPKEGYIRYGNPIVYTNKTTEYYRVFRECKMDPVSEELVDEKWGFSFPKQWDPYTGELFKEDDPHGPLMFDPDSLIYSIYIKRYSLLWTDENDTNEGFFHGYYGEVVGGGKDMTIVGRGSNIHLYPFRIPILDCYLTKDHNMSIITMGPLLTDEDALKIDELATIKNKYYPSSYSKMFKRQRPSLYIMKKLYDNAISSTPINLSFLKNFKDEEHSLVESMTPDELRDYYNRQNRLSVDELRKL